MQLYLSSIIDNLELLLGENSLATVYVSGLEAFTTKNVGRCST